jgi:hypothetical protein
MGILGVPEKWLKIDSTKSHHRPGIAEELR